jgi:hypothetical protein
LAALREATASFSCGSKGSATGPTRKKLALLSYSRYWEAPQDYFLIVLCFQQETTFQGALAIETLLSHAFKESGQIRQNSMLLSDHSNRRSTPKGLRGLGDSSGDANGSNPMKRYWEIIADNLSKAGWSWGLCVSD